MPRATPDYRAARAVLAAPYPLPVVFTRHTRPQVQPDQETIPGGHDASGNVGLSLLARNDTAHGFPAYNTHWRELPPAIPPIPYPPKDAEASCGQPTKRRINLTKHGRKGSGANGDYELMSGIEEEPSRELRNAREIGAWSLEVGRQTAGSGSGVSLHCGVRFGGGLRPSVTESAGRECTHEHLSSPASPSPLGWPLTRPAWSTRPDVPHPTGLGGTGGGGTSSRLSGKHWPIRVTSAATSAMWMA